MCKLSRVNLRSRTQGHNHFIIKSHDFHYHVKRCSDGWPMLPDMKS